MDPVLEVKPSACLLLLGPQLTRLESGRLSYRSLLEAGLTFLQQRVLREGDNGSSFAKEVSLDELRNMGYVSTMQKVVRALKEKGLYEEWLERTLGGSKLQSFDFPDSLQWVLELQQMGAMLACTQYDTLLDDLARQTPAVLQSSDPGFLKWLKKAGDTGCIKQEAQQQQEHEQVQARSISAELNGSEKSGILHLHGVHTVLESVSLLPYTTATHSSKHSNSREGDSSAEYVTDLSTRLSEAHLANLREIFLNRLVLMVGFDNDLDDPLLPSLLKVLYPDKDHRNLKNPPILLTSSPSCYALPSFSSPDIFLRLILPSPENLREIIVPGSSRNFAVGREHIDVSGRSPSLHSEALKVQAFLLFNEKQSFRKLGEIIYNQSKSGEIYVRRDALTVIFDHTKILYGNLVTYGGKGLRQLWDLIFSKDSTLAGKGLLGVGLHNSVIVWLNRKPKGLRNITGINSVHTNAAHLAIHSMAMSRHPSSSSGDSFSDSKSPLFSPVTTVTSRPAAAAQFQAAPSRSSNSSPPKQAVQGDKVQASTSLSTKIAATTSVTSMPPPLIAPMTLSPQTQFPIPTILPKSVAQGLPPLIGPPSLISGNRVQFPIPVAPAAGQQSPSAAQPLLPPMLPPMSIQRTVVPQQPTTSGLSSMIISGPFNQMDLEVLKDLQKKITDRLLSTQGVMVQTDEGTSEQGKAAMAPRLIEWKAAVDSPAVVEFLHCVAGPAEKLEQIPSHQERMRSLLAQHEAQIQCIDTRPPLQASPQQTPSTAATSLSGIAIAASPQATLLPISGTRTAQVSLTREPFFVQNPRAASRTASTTSPVSSSSSSPLIASAPSPCIAATPTTSTVASCPFTLPTSVTPAIPNPAVLPLPSPFPTAGIVAPLTLSQTGVSGTFTAAAGTAPGQSPVILLPQQAIGVLPSPQVPAAGGSYCLIQAPFQQPPQVSIANIAPPQLVASTTTPTTASSTVASLPPQVQNPASLIPGLTVPPPGAVLVNNMALSAGGVNPAPPMYFVVPAYPTVLPPTPAQGIAQAVPQTPIAATPVLHVAQSASVMLDQQRAMQQLSQLAMRNQEAAAAAAAAVAATGNGRQRPSLDLAARVGKRTRPLDLPDSMGEKILKIENPAAATSSSSPSKFSSMGTNQNHPRWPIDSSEGSGATYVVDVSKTTAHGQRTISSSESEESGKLSED